MVGKPRLETTYSCSICNLSSKNRRLIERHLNLPFIRMPIGLLFRNNWGHLGGDLYEVVIDTKEDSCEFIGKNHNILYRTIAFGKHVKNGEGYALGRIGPNSGLSYEGFVDGLNKTFSYLENLKFEQLRKGHSLGLLNFCKNTKHLSLVDGGLEKGPDGLVKLVRVLPPRKELIFEVTN